MLHVLGGCYILSFAFHSNMFNEKSVKQLIKNKRPHIILLQLPSIKAMIIETSPKILKIIQA